MKFRLILLLSIFAMYSNAQVNAVKSNKKGSTLKFSVEKDITHSDVKNQGATGTCWSFSSESFLESEIIKAGHEPVDLAEMFIARKAYEEKAEKYVRMLGKTNFGQGGEPHDVMNMMNKYGALPQEVYTGLVGDQKKYDHSELESVLKAFCDALVKTVEAGRPLSKSWKSAMGAILDSYLGKVPEKFDYKGKSYTPKSFSASLGINPEDYVEITSFTHHPFYQKFMIEIPDNWSDDLVYNVPLDELEAIADNAIANNYSIEWASDVSEKYFSHKSGLAIVPEKDFSEMAQVDKDSLFLRPVVEKTITQEMRQEGFDNQTTQDDHGMHITGMVADQTGKKYYVVKNSWGNDSNDNGGFFYCSKAYFRYKTTGIMVNKKAVPAAIAKKLGIM